MTQEQRIEQAAILALCRHSSAPWWNISLLVEEAGGAVALLDSGADAVESVELLALTIDDDARHDAAAVVEEMGRTIEQAGAKGARVISVLDEDYPANLRLVYDRPPFLFVRGALPTDDVRSLAVVGTRSASGEGLTAARSLAEQLTRRSVSVISGLARGIDAAAHEGALDAGGHTVAVVGTGIDIVYPKEHADLAERIVRSGGALVSQFLPGQPPSRFRFPLRNRTMSGLALGTAVIEASHTSGARMQARIALEHGKRVFLLSRLVTREPWARGMLARGAVEVESIEPIIDVIDTLEARKQQAAQLSIA